MSFQEKLTSVASDPHAMDLIEKTASKATYGASVGTVYLGYTSDEWGVIGIISGMLIGAATFSFNVWFRMKYMRPKNDEQNKP